MSLRCISTQPESIRSLLRENNLWCIQTLLENGLLMLDVLKKAIHEKNVIDPSYLSRQLVEYLLGLFESEPNTVLQILNMLHFNEVGEKPDILFKYEHTGFVEIGLILQLPLKLFIEYAQMKDIDLEIISCYIIASGRKDLVDWLLENMQIDDPYFLEDSIDSVCGCCTMYDLDSSIFESLVQKLFDNFSNDSRLPKSLDGVIYSMTNEGSAERERYQMDLVIATKSLNLIISYGYVTTDHNAAKTLYKWVKRNVMPDTYLCLIDPVLLEEICEAFRSRLFLRFNWTPICV